MPMKIHKEGYPTLIITGAALILLNVLAALGLPTGAFVVTFALSVVVWGFFAQFFRNPPRSAPDCPQAVIAPADGTIVAVETVRETEFFHEDRLKISIYMSALNVHLNRVPFNGQVIYAKYHSGRYLVAFHPKASELNERNTVVLERADGQRVLVRQIAGLLARRICFYLKVGQVVRAGEELGFIKFGSRCDVFLPLNANIRVQLQERVRGGETILAEL